MGQMLRMGLQNGTGTETTIGMDIVCLQNGTRTETPIGMDIVCLQNGTGTETPKQIDWNTESDSLKHGIR